MLVLLLLAFGIRAFLIPHGLPLLLHEDEPIYLGKAMQIGSGNFELGYFKKPSFFLYFYTAFYYLVYLYTPFLSWQQFEQWFWSDPTLVTSLGRLITVLFATASVFLTYMIGRRLFTSAIGIAAALWLAIDPVHLKFSPIVISDIPALFFILVSTWFAIKVADRGHWRDYLGCALAITLTVSFKYNVFIGIVLPAAHFVRHLSGNTSSLRQAFLDKRLWVSLSVIPIAFFILNPSILLNFETFIRDLDVERRHMLLRRANDPTREFEFMTSFDNIFFKILPRSLGWPIYVVGLVGILYAAWKNRYRAAIWLAFPLMFALVVSQFQLINSKYLLPVHPFWFLAAALVLYEATVFLKTRFLPHAHRLTALSLFTVLTLVLAIPLFKDAIEHLVPHRQADTRVLAYNYIRDIVKDGDRVVAEPDSIILDNKSFQREVHVAEWSAPQQHFATVPTPPMAELDVTQVQPDYVLLYFKADKEDGSYRMIWHDSYYAGLREGYEIEALFSEYPVALDKAEMQQTLDTHGFPTLYQRIRDERGKRDRPGPLMLLMRQKEKSD